MIISSKYNTRLKIIEDGIINSINPEWNKDEIIRYVYIYIGKLISKNVDFFYSLGGKLEYKNYSFNKLKRTYESKRINNLSVICKSSAIILKRIYDKLGIDSELMETVDYNQFTDQETNEKLDVHHWFLCVTGENSKKYFLTIIPDLFFIQFNMKTKHFANRIDYYREVDGKKIQIYKGPQINNTTLTDDEIEKIDEKIGYIIPYYIEENNGKRKKYNGYDDIFLENLRTYSRKNNYIIELGYDTDFFKDIISYKVNDRTIEEYLNTNSFDMNEIDKWIQYIKERATFYGHNPDIDKEVNGKILALRKSIENKDAKKYRNLIGQLGTNFVNDIYKIGENDYCSLTYIEKKFEYLFPKFFSCNESAKPLTSKFTGLAEQLDFIDMFIENMFPELKTSRASAGIKLNPKYSLVRNRIQRYVVYSTKRKKYDIIFCIDNSNTYFYFNPISGKFAKIGNLLNLISDEFIIVSDELKNRMREVENIEKPTKTL